MSHNHQRSGVHSSSCTWGTDCSRSFNHFSMFCVSENTEWEQGWCCHIILWHTELCQEPPCPTAGEPPLVWAPWPGFIAALGSHEVSGQAGAAEDVQRSPRLNKQLNSLPLAQNGAQSALPKTPNLFKCHITGAQNALSGNSDTHSGKLSKEKHHVSPPAKFLILF